MDADRPVRLEAGVVPYMLEEHLLRGDGAAGRQVGWRVRACIDDMLLL